MKMKYVSFLIALTLLMACTEKELSPITGSTGKPGTVDNIEVKNIPGGAEIYYKIPASDALMAVKAIYTVNGKEREVVASSYENKLKIVGFNDTEKHTASIYVVSRSMELSDPVNVEFIPEKSGLALASESLGVVEDFGGVRFEWINKVKERLTAELFGPDPSGKMQLLKVVQSDLEKNVFPLRGFGHADSELKFAVIFRDNYGNSTDTLSFMRTPLREDKIDKQNMSILSLKGDNSWDYAGEGVPQYLLDNNLDTYAHSTITNDAVSVTIDFGREIKLSRLVLFQRSWRGYYVEGNIKELELFQCNHRPSVEGNWGEWEKICDFSVTKPSGSPVGTETAEDIAAAENGFDILMTEDVKTRYIRIRVTKSWGNTNYSYAAELDVYGVETTE